MNLYWSYNYKGDPLSWEWFKYAIFSGYLFTYFEHKMFVRLVYPKAYTGEDTLADYFGDMFELAYEFEFALDCDVKTQCDKLAYIHKSMILDEPMLYMHPTVSPTSPTILASERPGSLFDIDEDCIYFLDRVSHSNRFSNLYLNIGVFEDVFDDRVMYVPKSLHKSIVEDVERIKKDYQFDDLFIGNIMQYIVQTHAIISNVEIRTIGKEPFYFMDEKKAMFLSNCCSLTFQNG